MIHEMDSDQLCEFVRSFLSEALMQMLQIVDVAAEKNLIDYMEKKLTTDPKYQQVKSQNIVGNSAGMRLH